VGIKDWLGTANVLRSTRQRVVLSFVVGFLIGLVLFGWSIWPVQWKDAAPADLQQEHGQTFLKTAARLYELDSSVDVKQMLGGDSWSGERLRRDLNRAYRGADAADQSRLVGLGGALGVVVDGEIPPPGGQSSRGVLAVLLVAVLGGGAIFFPLRARLRGRSATAMTPLRTRYAIDKDSLSRVTKYLFVRVATISITIVVGVFITVIIANKSGQLDLNVAKKIERQVQREIWMLDKLGSEERAQAIEQRLWELEEEVGLHLSFLPRHLRWTANALTFDWGEVLFTQWSRIYSMQRNTDSVKDIILDRLPNTLLLMGAAYLLIFLIGIPLALSLSRRHGHWQDRLLSFLAPISSIPSWVHAVLLMLIFALELRLLPFGGMFDLFPPGAKAGYILVVLKHMILPVAAIVISLLFQLVYAWRTFFLIYADEDYVELAKAKGLTFKALEKKHILRPSIPYVITSFAITLVGFWQTTTALEIVFDWPGIGQLYIKSLPHFWGESMFPGEMIIALAIVIIFAYLLGIMVLVLDVFYALADPRVRIGRQGATLRAVSKKARRRSFIEVRKGQEPPDRARQPGYDPKPVGFSSAKTGLSDLWAVISSRLDALKSVLRELVRYPTAVIGLVIVALLVGGSIYAVVALPYAEVGHLWYTDSVSGKSYVPKLAAPQWTNWFRKDDLLSTIVLNSRDDTASKTTQIGSNGTPNVMISFTFDYPYGVLPEELLVHFTPHYDIKRPFVIMTWVTPDGREIELEGLSIAAQTAVKISDYIPRGRALPPELARLSHFVQQVESGDPELAVLFADPTAEEFVPLKGTYTLRVDGLTFEEGTDLDAELVVLGQVYGLAGTDYMRRDLLVPLLWGMPFALLFGLLGAVLTTVAAMIVAAAAVWFGGVVDTFVQRITEANMILPILAISVLFYALYGVSLWTILGIIVLLNVFSSPTKAFRAAFLQIKEAPYIEAAQAYGASDRRIILRYLMPRIIPVLMPQLVALIPSYVFLEATLGMFNIKSDYPTWGRVIYEALKHGFSWGSRYWVLEPIFLLLLTGFAFAMLGFALDRILNPRLRME
jgi:peptide/nickel transport system permease protein